MENNEFEEQDAKDRFFDELLNDEDAETREFGAILMAVDTALSMNRKKRIS